MTTKTEVGTQLTKKPATFGDLLERMKPQIASVLPKHLTAERMLALVNLSATKTPKLKECTPLSLFNAVVTASRLGLEIGMHAHLVPFRNGRLGVTECVFIPDYRGLIHLAVASGKVKHIDVRVVYAGDLFDYQLGSAPSITHKPDIYGPRSVTDIVAFYCVAHLPDGTTVIDEPLSKQEVDAVRSRSRAKDDGPWVTDYQAMGRKTAVKRFCKWLPQTSELVAAIEADNRAETGEIGNVSAIIDSPETINAQVADATRERMDQLKDELAGSVEGASDGPDDIKTRADVAPAATASPSAVPPRDMPF